MFDRVKGWVVEIGSRPNYCLQWRDPITQRVRTKATAIPRAGVRSRSAAERLAGELEAQLMAGAGGTPAEQEEGGFIPKLPDHPSLPPHYITYII
jgi:hypothetical protein